MLATYYSQFFLLPIILKHNPPRPIPEFTVLATVATWLLKNHLQSTLFCSNEKSLILVQVITAGESEKEGRSFYSMNNFRYCPSQYDILPPTDPRNHQLLSLTHRISNFPRQSFEGVLFHFTLWHNYTQINIPPTPPTGHKSLTLDLGSLRVTWQCWWCRWWGSASWHGH